MLLRLNERQLDLFRWIADGCLASQPAERKPQAHGAFAGRARGLAGVGRKKVWTATITDAGLYYLEICGS
jgi:hypothetical protein